MIPCIHILKIISIEKGYHMNFDTEQKRPLLLARSVYQVPTETDVYKSMPASWTRVDWVIIGLGNGL